MSKVFRIQPSEFVDRITDDGRELTKLPYPFYVDEAGMVGRQDFWKGHPFQVIGFARECGAQEVNLWWREAVRDPSRAVGMYLVTADKDGQFGTHQIAVFSVELLAEDERSS